MNTFDESTLSSIPTCFSADRPLWDRARLMLLPFTTLAFRISVQKSDTIFQSYLQWNVIIVSIHFHIYHSVTLYVWCEGLFLREVESFDCYLLGFQTLAHQSLFWQRNMHSVLQPRGWREARSDLWTSCQNHCDLHHHTYIISLKPSNINTI